MLPIFSAMERVPAPTDVPLEIPRRDLSKFNTSVRRTISVVEIMVKEVCPPPRWELGGDYSMLVALFVQFDKYVNKHVCVCAFFLYHRAGASPNIMPHATRLLSPIDVFALYVGLFGLAASLASPYTHEKQLASEKWMYFRRLVYTESGVRIRVSLCRYGQVFVGAERKGVLHLARTPAAVAAQGMSSSRY